MNHYLILDIVVVGTSYTETEYWPEVFVSNLCFCLRCSKECKFKSVII